MGKSEGRTKNLELLTIYFNLNTLNTLFHEYGLQNGEKYEDVSKYITDYRLNQLRTQKNLKIIHGKERFEKEDPVVIKLLLKNISDLTIKIFKIDTQSYYRVNKTDFKNDVALDGLYPSTLKTANIDNENPFKVFEKEFTFPEIEREERGIFVVDFESQELSTRAVIKKGGISLMSQQTNTGVLFRILDEEKNVLKGEKTGVLVDNKWLRVDENGELLIPFSESSSYSN